jgi:ArsR family transcriptional regulator
MLAATPIDLDDIRSAADAACRLMKALSNPDRLLLLCQLSQGELCVGELEQRLHITQPTLSQQLAVLRDEGLVATRREGKHIHYRVASPQALAVLGVLYQQFCPIN